MHINNCADKIRSSTWLIVLKFKFKVRLLILFSDLNTNKIITKQQTELWTHQTSMNTPLICVQITFPTEKTLVIFAIIIIWSQKQIPKQHSY